MRGICRGRFRVACRLEQRARAILNHLPAPPSWASCSASLLPSSVATRRRCRTLSAPRAIIPVIRNSGTTSPCSGTTSLCADVELRQYASAEESLRRSLVLHPVAVGTQVANNQRLEAAPKRITRRMIGQPRSALADFRGITRRSRAGPAPGTSHWSGRWRNRQRLLVPRFRSS